VVDLASTARSGPVNRQEQLRQVFALKGDDGTALLDKWLRWARRCRLPAFVKLAKAITEHRPGIEAALTHGLSNARVESVNTKLRLLTRIAFGFRSADAPRGPGHARPRRPVPAVARSKPSLTHPRIGHKSPLFLRMVRPSGRGRSVDQG
jgi:hypothetical protein